MVWPLNAICCFCILPQSPVDEERSTVGTLGISIQVPLPLETRRIVFPLGDQAKE